MMPPVEEIISHSVEETEAIAGQLAATLNGAECIALQGDLGAGKTQFVRGLVRALGANASAVSSPTFVLLHVYDGGRLTVYHLDAYRVAGPEDFESIGFSELLEQAGVVIVEWAERVAAILPTDCILIDIEPTGETERRIVIRRGAVSVE